MSELHHSMGSFAFDYQPTSRIRFGAGCLGELGERARDLGGTRALLVSDPGLVAAGHVKRACDYLEAAGLEVFLFTDVEENPTTEHVANCERFARAQGSIDIIVGLGGGSAMDCAKGVNFLLSHGGKMEDYWGKGLASGPMLPSMGIPTTAGTGSEAQCFALISREDDHRKMACGDIQARFRTVLLDPELLTSVPKEVAANAGLDAITHAVETAVTLRRNPISDLYSREAFRLLAGNFEQVLSQPQDVTAWGHMMLGAHFAGAAIENSMLGAAHACANPLTAHFGVTHGTAVAVMLPHVIRYNSHEVGTLYRQLVQAAGWDASSDEDAREQLVSFIYRALDVAGIPSHLAALGVSDGSLSQLAEDAKLQWTGTFNPRPLTVAEFLGLYEMAYSEKVGV